MLKRCKNAPECDQPASQQLSAITSHAAICHGDESETRERSSTRTWRLRRSYKYLAMHLMVGLEVDLAAGPQVWRDMVAALVEAAREKY